MCGYLKLYIHLDVKTNVSIDNARIIYVGMWYVPSRLVFTDRRRLVCTDRRRLVLTDRRWLVLTDRRRLALIDRRRLALTDRRWLVFTDRRRLALPDRRRRRATYDRLILFVISLVRGQRNLSSSKLAQRAARAICFAILNSTAFVIRLCSRCSIRDHDPARPTTAVFNEH